MPNLKKLKERLEKLPQLKSERNLSAKFGIYTQRIAQSREKLSKSFRDMEFISKVYPEAQCKQTVLPLLKKSIKEANKLYQSIDEDAQTVQKKATDNGVVRLGEYANSASGKCHDIWMLEITNNVTKWEKLASVIQNLGAKGGQEFKKAVETLKNKNIPRNDDEVTEIEKIKIELQKGVANLGLEGPFGEFLKATSEVGASPRDLLEDEIKEKMEEYSLWDSFRVRLE